MDYLVKERWIPTLTKLSDFYKYASSKQGEYNLIAGLIIYLFGI